MKEVKTKAKDALATTGLLLAQTEVGASQHDLECDQATCLWATDTGRSDVSCVDLGRADPDQLHARTREEPDWPKQRSSGYRLKPRGTSSGIYRQRATRDDGERTDSPGVESFDGIK